MIDQSVIQKKIDQARTSALAWLSLVDEGRANESWDAAAKYLRSAVSKDQWRQTLGSVRQPLGGVNSRKEATAQFATELPGAPDGEYVVIQFNTSFENKNAAVETVTPMLELDGTFRVSGYYVQ